MSLLKWDAGTGDPGDHVVATLMLGEVKMFLKHDQLCLQMPSLLKDLLEMWLKVMLLTQSIMSANRAMHLGTAVWVLKKVSSTAVVCRLNHRLGATTERIWDLLSNGNGSFQFGSYRFNPTWTDVKLRCCCSPHWVVKLRKNWKTVTWLRWTAQLALSTSRSNFVKAFRRNWCIRNESCWQTMNPLSAKTMSPSEPLQTDIVALNVLLHLLVWMWKVCMMMRAGETVCWKDQGWALRTNVWLWLVRATAWTLTPSLSLFACPSPSTSRRLLCLVRMGPRSEVWPVSLPHFHHRAHLHHWQQPQRPQHTALTRARAKGNSSPDRPLQLRQLRLRQFQKMVKSSKMMGMRTMSLMTMPKTATEMMPRIQTKSKMNQKLILEKLPKFWRWPQRNCRRSLWAASSVEIEM